MDLKRKSYYGSNELKLWIHNSWTFKEKFIKVLITKNYEFFQGSKDHKSFLKKIYKGSFKKSRTHKKKLMKMTINRGFSEINFNKDVVTEYSILFKKNYQGSS